MPTVAAGSVALSSAGVLLMELPLTGRKVADQIVQVEVPQVIGAVLASLQLQGRRVTRTDCRIWYYGCLSPSFGGLWRSCRTGDPDMGRARSPGSYAAIVSGRLWRCPSAGGRVAGGLRGETAVPTRDIIRQVPNHRGAVRCSTLTGASPRSSSMLGSGPVLGPSFDVARVGLPGIGDPGRLRRAVEKRSEQP